jgi:hypothetical protein
MGLGELLRWAERKSGSKKGNGVFSLLWIMAQGIWERSKRGFWDELLWICALQTPNNLRPKNDSRTQAHSYNQFYMWLQQLVSEHSLFDSGLSNYMIHTLKKNFKKLTFLVAQKSRMLQSTPLTGISSLRFKGSLHLEDGSRGLTKVDDFY